MKDLFDVRRTCFVLLGLWVTGSSAWAQDDSCMNALRGTYLLTIEDASGAFASRAIMSISADGAVLVADSRQRTDRFGLQIGDLSCSGNASARSVTLDFGRTEADGEQDIARSDWVLSNDEQGISGKVDVVLYQPVESCDPIRDASACVADPQGTFSFSGSRLTADPR